MGYDELPEWTSYTPSDVAEALEVCKKKISKTGKSVTLGGTAIGVTVAGGNPHDKQMLHLVTRRVVKGTGQPVRLRWGQPPRQPPCSPCNPIPL